MNYQTPDQILYQRREWEESVAGESDREEGGWCGRRKERELAKEVRVYPMNQRRSGDHLIRAQNIRESIFCSLLI
jgi:hypothetical protein